MNREEYKSKLGKQQTRPQSYWNRLNSIRDEKKAMIEKENEEFRTKWRKDFKCNLDYYMNTFLKYGVKEETFIDTICSESAMSRFFDGDEEVRIVLDVTDNMYPTTIYIICMLNADGRKVMNIADTQVTTVEEFNRILEKTLKSMFGNMYEDVKAIGCIRYRNAALSYENICDKSICTVLDRNGAFSVCFTNPRHNIWQNNDVDVISNEEFRRVVSKSIKKYVTYLNEILSIVDMCKVYQSDDKQNIFIVDDHNRSTCSRKDAAECYFDIGFEWIHDTNEFNTQELVGNGVFETFLRKSTEIKDKQMKESIIRDLIKFTNEIENEAIGE